MRTLFLNVLATTYGSKQRSPETMPPNVILITIDCLRADHVGCFGYPRPTTPNIDNMTREAVVFTNAISNGPYTTASFPSIFTSAISLRYCGEDYPLSRERITIAEILQKNRYSTAAFHSNPYLSSNFGYDRGFDYFEDFNVRPESGEAYGLSAYLNNRILTLIEERGLRHTWLYKFFRLSSLYCASLIRYSEAYATGAILNERFFSWLEKNPARFFVWLHYMDVHAPYIPSRKYRKQFYSKRISNYKEASILFKMQETPELVSKEEVEILVDLYDAEVCYVDKCIGDLIERLKAKEIYDDSLIIITSDHGEEFKEHGGFTHEAKLYDELLHVPLIMKMPDGAHHRKVNGQCSLRDLAPTILDVLKLPMHQDFEGSNLLTMIKETGRSEVISACGLVNDQSGERKKLISLRTQKWKYIFKEGEKDELYNLLDDPMEKKNLIETYPKKGEELKSKLFSRWSEIHYDLSSTPSIFADEGMKRRLKALGYA